MSGLLLDQPLSELHCAQVVCGVGRGDRLLRHHNTLPRTLGVALAQCGLEEAAQVALLEQRIKEAAEAALTAVLALEAGLSVEQRGGRQVHVDFLGEHWRRGSVWAAWGPGWRMLSPRILARPRRGLGSHSDRPHADPRGP